MNLKQGTIVGLIALLMLSSVGSVVLSPVAVVSAAENSTSCDGRLTWDASGVDCVSFQTPDQEYADKLDVLADADSAEAQATTALQMLENSVYDAETRGWLEAEEGFLNAYLDGDSKSQATQAGLDAMASHYAIRQKNFIEVHNNFLTTIYGIQSSTSNLTTPTASSSEYLFNERSQYPAIKIVTDDVTSAKSPSPDAIVVDLRNVTYEQRTLVDGSTTPVQHLDLTATYLAYYNNKWTMHEYSDAYTPGSNRFTMTLLGGTKYVHWTNQADTVWAEFNATGLKAQSIPSDYPDTQQEVHKITRFEKWGDIWTSYQQSYQTNSAAFETWANRSYDALENGTISAEDVLSRLNEMEQTADLSGAKNMTFNEGVVALSSMGLAAPGNSTAYMNISYQTAFDAETITETGLLMSQSNPPGDTWETGVTYNSSDLGGAQVVVGLDGDQAAIRGDFTIHGAYTSNGSAIEDPTITVNDPEYKATNLTDLRDKITELSNRIDTLRNQTVATGGTGTLKLTWPSIPTSFAGLGLLLKWGIGGLIVIIVLSTLN